MTNTETRLSHDTLKAGLAARYGDSLRGASLDAVTANSVLETLVMHRSVRAYSDAPLPGDLLPIIVAAAQSASTSSHLQIWSVIAVEDPARKARLSVLAGGQPHVAQAPLLLIFLADLSRLRAIGAERGVPVDGLTYLETFIAGVADASLAAQNSVIALESLGLGCCYIGAMRNSPEAVARELDLPAEAFAVFGLTVGYPDPDVQTDIKPRLPQDVVLHREVYARAPVQAFETYDVRMKLFQRKQHMPEAGWTSQASGRVRGPEAMSGRDRIRAALARLGFGLA
jgi:nitroreductase